MRARHELVKLALEEIKRHDSFQAQLIDRPLDIVYLYATSICWKDNIGSPSH
jgi:hypothetical protein